MAGRYPLQALLRLRREIEEQRERRLGGANAACQRAEAEVADARARLEEQRLTLAEARGQLVAAGLERAAERHVRGRYIDRLRREAERRTEELEHADRRAHAAREAAAAAGRALREASAALKVVERDHAVWDQARRAEEERRAELELEDLVASRQGLGQK
jgi:hypothetical protein